VREGGPGARHAEEGEGGLRVPAERRLHQPGTGEAAGSRTHNPRPGI